MIVERKSYELFGNKLIEKLVIKSPFRIPSPMPEEACFLYVLEGAVIYQLEKKQMDIPARDAVLLKCGNYFGQINNTRVPGKQEIVLIHFHPHILKRIYDKEIPGIFQVPQKIDASIAMEKINNDFLVEKYIEGLLFYFDNPSLVSDEILILKLKEIILLMSQTKNASVIQQILAQLYSPATYLFKQVVDDNIYSHLPAEGMAKLINVSVSSFKREFKRLYDDTPANYFRNKKLEKAAGLLVNSDERITQIAYDCGFSSLEYFSKCFQKKFNTTPSLYRLNQ